ncbi:MAG: urease accessory protein UreD [Stellaceae bacterium]
MTEGAAEIRFALRDGVTRLAHLYQRDPLRVLFPTPAAGDPPVAVIVTTSGGLVAGDRLDIRIELAPGGAAHVTASAAEKIYRSTGRTTTIKQTLSIGPGAALEFLPPETILFDGARLRRETTVDLAPGSAFLGGDIVIFGRRARGERFANGFLREVWELRRDGDLVWGDALHLEDEAGEDEVGEDEAGEDDVGRIIDDPACFDGASAFATMILSPPAEDARSLLETARVVQSSSATTGLRAGATAVSGLIIARWLAADAAALRRAYADLACHFRSAVLGLPDRLPRVWHV